MKVERINRDPFTPIVITIETQEEAETIYAMLNCGVGARLEDYIGKERVSISTKDKIWKIYRDVYREQ
jgi:hypothetical protein